MVFIPVVPHERPPSGRALDLGRRLKAEVEKFEAQYPGTSREDLRAAALLAIGEERASGPARQRVAAVMMGLVGALVALGVLLNEGRAPWPIVSMMVAAMIAAFVAVIARRSRR